MIPPCANIMIQVTSWIHVARAIHQQSYHVSQKERQAMKEQVKQIIEDCIIHPSISLRKSLITRVNKKHVLRAVSVSTTESWTTLYTKKDVYPLRRTHDFSDRLYSERSIFLSLIEKVVTRKSRCMSVAGQKRALSRRMASRNFECSIRSLLWASTFQRVMNTVFITVVNLSCLFYRRGGVFSQLLQTSESATTSTVGNPIG